jgi:hypothetical protein
MCTLNPNEISVKDERAGCYNFSNSVDAFGLQATAGLAGSLSTHFQKLDEEH